MIEFGACLLWVANGLLLKTCEALPNPATNPGIINLIQPLGPITNVTSRVTLPPEYREPYDISIPDTQMGIEFYGYGAELPIRDLNGAMSKATYDLLSHRANSPEVRPTPMGTAPRSYRGLGTGKVTLTVYPKDDITWGEWFDSFAWLKRVIVERLELECTFIVFKTSGAGGEEGGEIAYGAIQLDSDLNKPAPQIIPKPSR